MPTSDLPQVTPPASLPQSFESPVATAPVQAGRGVLTDFGKNAITVRAEQIVRNTDEGMIWSETPSLVLMIPVILKYLAVLLLLTAGAYVLRQQLTGPGGERLVQLAAQAEAGQRSAHGTRRASAPHGAEATRTETRAGLEMIATYAYLVPAALGILFAARLGVLLLRLKTTQYSASSQRLVVESGILNTINVPYELHTLSNAIIRKPLLLRPFGVANVYIATPRIALLGLRNAGYVRDVLRQSGQLEAQRIDKVRWR